MFFLSMITNPITINSFVVFLRLYWFEKRFQNVVQEARQRRGTISKSKSKAKNESDQVERGVNGRNITVMHNGAKSRIANDGVLLDPIFEKESSREDGAVPEDEIDPKTLPVRPHESRHPEIKFANTVKRSDGLGEEAMKAPPKLSEEEHIAILERQRHPQDDEVLRIPGPRDADRGMLPKLVLGGEGHEPEPMSPHGREVSMDLTPDTPSRTAGTRQQAITIEEPRKPAKKDDLAEDAKAIAKAFSPSSITKALECSAARSRSCIMRRMLFI